MIVHRHAVSLLGVVKLRARRGRVAYVRFPDGPTDPNTEVPSYPDSAAPGKLLYAWNEARNHPYNLFVANVFASSLILGDKYAWYGFQEAERPAIMEAFLNTVKTMGLRKRQMETEMSTSQPAVLTKIAMQQQAAKDGRRTRVSLL